MKYCIDVIEQQYHSYQKITTSQSSILTAKTSIEDLINQLNSHFFSLKYRLYSFSASILAIIFSNIWLSSTLNILFITFCICLNLGIYLFICAKKQITLHYNFPDQEKLEDYLYLLDWIQNLTDTDKMWFVDSKLLDPNPKYSSITRYFLRYKPLKIKKRKAASYISVNIPFYTIKLNKNLLFFLPDQILVKTPNSYISKSYADIKTSVVYYRRIESLKKIPNDTQILAPIKYNNLEPAIKKKFKKKDQLFLVQYRMITLQLANTCIYEQMIFSRLVKSLPFLGGSINRLFLRK